MLLDKERQTPGRTLAVSHSPIPNGHCSRHVRAASVALAMCIAAAAALGQSPPILNSPYVCANGITYTVTTCKPYRADQWCETVEKQNGNLVTSMDSTWSSMTGRLAGCTNGPNAKPQAGSPPAPPAAGAQQTFNPPYLKEFPTVDQIMAQLKGSNVQDTAYRQLTALHEFAQMIVALAGPRMAQNQLTPDEARIVTNYFNAYNNLAKSTTNPQDAYAGNPDFTASLFQTFKMPTIQQLWETSNKMSGGQQPGTNPQQLPPTSDPSQLAIRRCFELGGTGLQCVGAGMSEGMKQMMGIDVSALMSSGKAGLVVLGTFTAQSGLGFTFDDSGVNIGPCGLMVNGSHNYSVSESGGKYLINIANQPQPLLVTLGLDGKAVGPVSQDITGQKITGYTVTTNVKTGVVVSKVPMYSPITAHCNVGSLTPGPGVAVDPGLPSSTPTVLSAIGTVLDTMSGNAPQQLMLPPGPRMAGVFASAGGLKIQFNDGSTVLDCSQAHILTQYDVSLQRGRIVVAVKNGTNPFSLNVQPDGSLAGSGTVTVNGKLMTALDDNANPVFAPTNASCPVDSLKPAK